MFDLVLYEPEIPPNTGNIIRVCANTGTRLHLVHPLGFDISDRKLRRAGLDYHEFAPVKEHANWEQCHQALGAQRLFAVSTRGTRNYADVEFQPDDVILLGPETRGLPQELLDGLPAAQILRIPMRPHNRSLNLANAAAVLLYEAWRQQGFAGGT